MSLSPHEVDKVVELVGVEGVAKVVEVVEVVGVAKGGRVTFSATFVTFSAISTCELTVLPGPGSSHLLL